MINNVILQPCGCSLSFSTIHLSTLLAYKIRLFLGISLLELDRLHFEAMELEQLALSMTSKTTRHFVHLSWTVACAKRPDIVH